MGRKEISQQPQKEKQRVQSVLEILKKQSPLTIKQDKFCNNGCVERFLKAKGDNVKKAAKLLRTCLAWRDAIGIDSLIADEFSAELADGIAYVAGNDDELRPVMMFRLKQDYQKLHSQKLFTRLLVFTLEVAIQTMPKNVDQFVLLFDATADMSGKQAVGVSEALTDIARTAPEVSWSCLEVYRGIMAFFRSASSFMNMLLATLKILGDYYPGRLHKAFVIDPPSLFSYLWKGMKPFVELSSLTSVVSSLDFEESIEFNDLSCYPRAASLRFDPSTGAKLGSCSSSRFSFTVSHHLDSLKPWYLSFADTSASKVGPTNHHPVAFSGPAISPLNARSYSFASPVARGPRGNFDIGRKRLFPSTPMAQRTQKLDFDPVRHPRTPNPSFLKSPALFFRRGDSQPSRVEKSRESFTPFLKFYRRPYDEMIYRSKMRPPLGGLISIVSPQLRRNRHISMSQRF